MYTARVYTLLLALFNFQVQLPSQASAPSAMMMAGVTSLDRQVDAGAARARGQAVAAWLEDGDGNGGVRRGASGRVYAPTHAHGQVAGRRLAAAAPVLPVTVLTQEVTT